MARLEPKSYEDRIASEEWHEQASERRSRPLTSFMDVNER